MDETAYGGGCGTVTSKEMITDETTVRALNDSHLPTNIYTYLSTLSEQEFYGRFFPNLYMDTPSMSW